MEHLEELNPSQREAVTFNSGPLLLLAGAGSGKTKVLTTRIAHLIKEHNTPAGNILALTFTNKAAGEMKNRLASLLGPESEGVWLGTFHGIGLRILKTESRLSGLAGGLTVYDANDQLRLVKSVMEELGIGTKAISPKAVVGRINKAKNELLSPEKYRARYADFFSERVSRVYELYQKKLSEMQALDFGDLICKPVELFIKHPETLRKYQEKFQHILVDEYQDTNHAQYILMSNLAALSRNICAVGDPDQSIYGWRGADIRNIMEFERDWDDATIMRLEQNYRSTSYILSAANSVIKNNDDRYEKNLWTENPDGSPVIYRECDDERQESGAIIKAVKDAMRGAEVAEHYRDFAVFYRTNAQSRLIEEFFLREGIPYVIVGGVKFYERLEIKDALAYLRLISNPKDELSLKRIINVPPRGIGAVTLNNIANLAMTEGITLIEGVGRAIEDGLLKKPAQREFFKTIVEGRKKLKLGMPLHEIAQQLIEETGYIALYEKEGSEEAFQRIENLQELISAIKDFEDSPRNAPDELIETEGTHPMLSAFLEHVSLISDLDSYKDKTNAVTLMTLHSAKGLEFPVVFMTGLEEGLFPHSRSADNPEELEEERRLCYVGMTRAMKQLHLLSARSRTIFGERRYQVASRFIEEIDPKYLVRHSNAPKRASYGGLLTEESVSIPQGGGRKNRGGDEPYYTLDESQLNPLTEPTFDREDPWRIGMRVRHPSFGIGVIKAREGTGESTKLTVNFQKAGRKKLVAQYAALEPVMV
ncbi:ATP-dependent DNA helicase UvrD/PcrA [hydrothermal vent metagenome]|uniref:DNA 3'-5' helicase n=1 Tax=hydrothermal vent metagenome TaxID=652676 RepID=A0A3B0VYR2_9ZZZZ